MTPKKLSKWGGGAVGVTWPRKFFGVKC